jgi:hypothetical protein
VVSARVRAIHSHSYDDSSPSIHTHTHAHAQHTRTYIHIHTLSLTLSDTQTQTLARSFTVACATHRRRRRWGRPTRQTGCSARPTGTRAWQSRRCRAGTWSWSRWCQTASRRSRQRSSQQPHCSCKPPLQPTQTDRVDERVCTCWRGQREKERSNASHHTCVSVCVWVPLYLCLWVWLTDTDIDTLCVHDKRHTYARTIGPCPSSWCCTHRQRHCSRHSHHKLHSTRPTD